MNTTKIFKFSSTAFVALTLITLSVSGCSSKPTKFYVLTSLAEVDNLQNSRSGDTLSIGIGPIKLPDYVNRPQIVTKNGGNELVIDEFHRWAESLNNNVSRVLSDNFATLLGTENINTYPWNRFVPIDYQVAIDVTRFDSVVGEEATLEARWSLLTDRGRKEILRKRSKITKTPAADDFDSIVLAESEALAELSQIIADEINLLQESNKVALVR